jgi:hypothetical protein
MGQRLLLCRPQGGLNDMLSQIEACCRYAEKAGRTVVVDTAYPGGTAFQDDFRNYFESKQSRLLLSLDEPGATLDAIKVAPEFLQGRVSTYSAIWGPNGAWNAKRQRPANAWLDAETRKPLTFDFLKDHPQELLLHHSEGRNQVSPYALMRLVVARKVTDELKRRLDAIGRPYDAIHIRHTDMKTSYEPTLESIRKSPPQKVFVATDNIQVLDDFRAALGPDRVFSFSSLPATAGEPLHKGAAHGESRFARNQDAIVDLLMLALSRQLLIVKVQEGPEYSGFSKLAQELWHHKIMLKHLLGRDDIEFGLN